MTPKRKLDPNLRPAFAHNSDDPPGEPIKGFVPFPLGVAKVFVDKTGTHSGMSCEHCNNMHMMCFSCFKDYLDGTQPNGKKGTRMEIAEYPNGEVEQQDCACDECIAQRPGAVNQAHSKFHPTGEEQRPHPAFPDHPGPVVEVVLLRVDSLPAHPDHCEKCNCNHCCQQCREHRTVERYIKEENGEVRDEDKMKRAKSPFWGQALRVLCWSKTSV